MYKAANNIKLLKLDFVIWICSEQTVLLVIAHEEGGVIRWLKVVGGKSINSFFFLGELQIVF